MQTRHVDEDGEGIGWHQMHKIYMEIEINNTDRGPLRLYNSKGQSRLEACYTDTTRFLKGIIEIPAPKNAFLESPDTKIYIVLKQHVFLFPYIKLR